MSKTLVILSGGMDSTTLLYGTRSQAGPRGVEAITFDYGQRHGDQEIAAARRTCEDLDVVHHLVDVSNLQRHLKGSALTDPQVEVPHGHYEDDTMRKTVVPNRNMVMVSMSVAVAIARDCQWVGYAAHAGDHAVYPDCRPEFGKALGKAIALCHYDPPELWTPYIEKTKAEICLIGNDLDVNWENTWSCYEGGTLHCGQCGTCVERKEAFDLAGVKDPTGYHLHPIVGGES